MPLNAQENVWPKLFGASGPTAAESADLEKKLAALHHSIEKGRETKQLFQVTQQDRAHFLVVHYGQFDKAYLFSSTVERGAGEQGSYSTIMDRTFLFSFRRIGDKIQFVRRQMEYRAREGTPELKAIGNSIPDDILGVTPIVADDSNAGYLVISAEDLFLKDLTHIGAGLEATFAGQAVRLSDKESSLDGILALPLNVEVRAQLVFNLAAKDAKEGASSSSLLGITMRYSLTQLPDSPSFAPRPADPRVGYFTTDFQDLSRPDLKDRLSPDVHWINRWNLEKKDPNAPVSEVKKPIVFWLEDTVPLDVRPAVRAGVLAWNAAFEALGFKNAIVVKEVDKDLSAQERASFDPADISHNMVRWFVGKDARFALGPSRVNPLTGEIFHASISVGDMLARVLWQSDLRPPNSAGAAGLNLGVQPQEIEIQHLQQARHEAATALALLEGRSEPLSELEKKRFIQEFITEIIAHEVGHTLGLRHNFKASEMLSMEEMNKGGLQSASVMDYLPAYVAPPGKPQGSYSQTKIGPYDQWAIEYGYKSLSGNLSAQKAALESIAARAASDPRLTYGTDEDVQAGIDPDAQQFDMGKGALPFAQLRVGLARDLWKRLETEASRPGADSRDLGEKFMAGDAAYFGAVKAVLPMIGGIRTSRDPKQGHFEPVSASEQRAALAFLEENVFRAEPFEVSPGLLQKLGNDVSKAYPNFNRPFPIANAVLTIQASALQHLYNSSTLNRLSDQELFVGKPGGQFTPGEMMTRVRLSVWSELLETKPQPIRLYRRNLQHEHLAVLIKTAQDSSVRGEVRAAAWRDIERLARDLNKSLKVRRDETSSLHLQEMLRQAQEALDQ